MKSIKRSVSLLLTAVMALSLITAGCAAEDRVRFDDVPADTWYTEAVEYCRENGLIDGISAAQFGPNGDATRAVLTTALYRQAGEPAVTGTDSFADTAENAWYSNAVLWAAQKGIVNGYGNGCFGTDDPVTREQIVTMLWRMAGSPTAKPGESFADQDAISGYAVAAVTWAKENGIVNGRGDGRFYPQGNVTRAEAAVILTNYAKMSGDIPGPAKARILVAYFSATNNTENIANHIKAIFGSEADLYEIHPETPYTSADLNYNNNSSRANREQRDPAARPAITGTVANMEQYDVIFLGYPIWHGQAPKIIYTFVETYDLTGKTVVPFCTSGSSGMGSSAANLAAVTSGADWLEGRRFSGSTSQSAVGDWVNGLDLPKTAPDHNEEETNKVYLQISGAQNALWTATLAENSSAQALKELLGNGPLTIEMHDYSNFEKVGPIGQNLPTNDERITTAAGDIILYQGSSLVIYYDTNSWSFTRLGRVDNVTQAEMKEVLGPGDVTATLSLTAPGS